MILVELCDVSPVLLRGEISSVLLLADHTPQEVSAGCSIAHPSTTPSPFRGNYSQWEMPQNNTDLNGVGRQKAPFLHMSSSFSSCHSDIFKQRVSRSWKTPLLQTPTWTKFSELPSLQHLLRILLNAYQKKKKIQGAESFKQKAQWCNRRNKLPSSSRRVKNKLQNYGDMVRR